MPVRVYVSDKSLKRLEHALERTADMDKGAPYFQLDLDPNHPASHTGGCFAPEDVLGVTWKETVYAGFRPDGYYEIGDAHVMVKTVVSGGSQIFSAWGKDYKTLQRLVLRVRTGELQPRFDFTAKAKVEVSAGVIESEVTSPNRIGLALKELLDSAILTGMREISHSVTQVRAGESYLITVAGLVPQIHGPNFD